MEENESTYYAQIPITVMYDSRLKPIERLLYGTIAMLSKKSGYCYANNGYLAELYKCSEMAISKYIKNLSFYGYITIANANSYKRQIYLSDLKQMIKEPITNDIGTYNKRYRNLKQTYEHNNNNPLISNLNNVTIKKENVKEKPAKHKYGEYQNVFLSDDELKKLKEEFPADWQQRIERVSEYVASTGKHYVNFLATIRNWAKRDKTAQPPKQESLEEIGRRITAETEKARAEGKSMTPEEMKQKVLEEMKRKGMKIVGNSTPA